MDMLWLYSVCDLRPRFFCRCSCAFLSTRCMGVHSFASLLYDSIHRLVLNNLSHHVVLMVKSPVKICSAQVSVMWSEYLLCFFAVFLKSISCNILSSYEFVVEIMFLSFGLTSIGGKPHCCSEGSSEWKWTFRCHPSRQRPPDSDWQGFNSLDHVS